MLANGVQPNCKLQGTRKVRNIYEGGRQFYLNFLKWEISKSFFSNWILVYNLHLWTTWNTEVQKAKRKCYALPSCYIPANFQSCPILPLQRVKCCYSHFMVGATKTQRGWISGLLGYVWKQRESLNLKQDLYLQKHKHHQEGNYRVSSCVWEDCNKYKESKANIHTMLKTFYKPTRGKAPGSLKEKEMWSKSHHKTARIRPITGQWEADKHSSHQPHFIMELPSGVLLLTGKSDPAPVMKSTGLYKSWALWDFEQSPSPIRRMEHVIH